jgi:hypothetical protein
MVRPSCWEGDSSMRAYFKTASTFLLCVAGAALAGCFSAAVAPPAANAPCTSADGCPAGYQCRPATTGASGTFCCKDKSSCGPAGIDGSVRDATIGLDGAGALAGSTFPPSMSEPIRRSALVVVEAWRRTRRPAEISPPAAFLALVERAQVAWMPPRSIPASMRR